MEIIKSVIKNFFTGPNNSTYAIGRIMSVPSFVLGHWGFGHAILQAGDKVDFAALGVGYAAYIGAITVLITGTNLTEPKA